MTENFKILLADDNPVNRKYVEVILRKEGYDVFCVENGKELLSEYVREKYDIILMDIQMPEMNGVEATRKIREMERISGEKVQIIAYTAYAMEGDREKLLEAGMDGYISKPALKEVFLEEIESQLRFAGKYRDD